jgi:hypothetical protein
VRQQVIARCARLQALDRGTIANLNRSKFSLPFIASQKFGHVNLYMKINRVQIATIF